eukprot:142210_1
MDLNTKLLEISIIDSIGLLGVCIPTSLFLYKRFQHMKHFISRYSPQSVHIELYNIVRCNQIEPKYKLAYRSVFHKPLNTVISNEYGLRRIQKAANNSSFENPFIRMQTINDNWFVYGSIISQMEQEYKHLWFERDQNLLKRTNQMVRSQKYILALSGAHHHITLSNQVMQYMQSIWNGIKGRPQSNFQVSRRIRGFMINVQTVENIVNEISNIDENKWLELLDISRIEDKDERLLDRELRWNTIKKMIDHYDNGERLWTEPLCTIDIPFTVNETAANMPFDDIPSSNTYHPEDLYPKSINPFVNRQTLEK